MVMFNPIALVNNYDVKFLFITQTISDSGSSINAIHVPWEIM